MKKLISLLVCLSLLCCTAASAEFLGDLLGGVTSAFSTDDGVVHKVGDKVELNGATITLNKVSGNSGKSYYKPADGNEYVICELTIKNTGSEELVISSVICFNASFDGRRRDISLEGLAVALLKGKPQLDTVIEPGKKFKGVVAYEVPKDWEELRLEVTPEGLGERAVFGTTNR